MEFLDVPDEMRLEFIQGYTQAGQLDLMAGVFDGDLDQLWMMQDLLDRHDTLKANADLLDELVRVYEKPYCTANVMQLLSKAKDL